MTKAYLCKIVCLKIMILVVLYIGCNSKNEESLNKENTSIEKLVSELKSKDWSYRYTAVTELGKIRSKKSIDGLIEALKDKDENIRNLAIENLAFFGKFAEDKLIDALKSRHRDQVVSVIYILGKIKSVKSVEQLIKLLKSNDSFFRQSAAFSLGEIKSKEAINLLMDTLKDSDPIVQGQAAIALGKMKHLEAIDLILNLMHEKDEYLHNSLIIALGYMKSDRKKVVEVLINVLKKDDFLPRSHATESLIKIGSKKVVKELIIILENKNEKVRNLAVARQ